MLLIRTNASVTSPKTGLSLRNVTENVFVLKIPAFNIALANGNRAPRDLVNKDARKENRNVKKIVLELLGCHEL
jgi:hypothetical protein